MKKATAVIILLLLMVVIMSTTTFKTEDVFCGVPQRSVVSAAGPNKSSSAIPLTMSRDSSNTK